jgi:hypothetical protein
MAMTGRHDRTGEEILEVADEWPDIPTHDPRCDGTGWIDRDADPAIACLDCKPWLRKDELRRKTFGPLENTRD